MSTTSGYSLRPAMLEGLWAPHWLYIMERRAARDRPRGREMLCGDPISVPLSAPKKFDCA